MSGVRGLQTPQAFTSLAGCRPQHCLARGAHDRAACGAHDVRWTSRWPQCVCLSVRLPVYLSACLSVADNLKTETEVGPSSRRAAAGTNCPACSSVVGGSDRHRQGRASGGGKVGRGPASGGNPPREIEGEGDSGAATAATFWSAAWVLFDCWWEEWLQGPGWKGGPAAEEPVGPAAGESIGPGQWAAAAGGLRV